MLISYVQLLTSVFVVVLLSVIAVVIYRNKKCLPCKTSVYLSGGFLSFCAISGLLCVIMPSVCVVTQLPSGNLVHESKLAFFSYRLSDGECVGMKYGNKYLVNESLQELILWPVYYSSSGEAEGPKKTYIFKPNTVTKIAQLPDYFFCEPDDFLFDKKRKSVVVKWCLESKEEYDKRDDVIMDMIRDVVVNNLSNNNASK